MHVCLCFVAQGVSEKDLVELVKFRDAVVSTDQQNDLITLPKDVKWPQLGAEPLFVRHFYHGCFTGPLQSLTQDPDVKYRKFVIIGNPGIGKSAFGCYLLYQAIRAKRTVVYHSFKGGGWVNIFHSDGKVSRTDGLNTSSRSLLDNPSTVYISDSITPETNYAFTVLITSPCRERWYEYSKSSDCRILCFPVFSEQEIQSMYEKCFPQLARDHEEAGGEQGVRERYSKWGGLPRHVLDKHTSSDQNELDSALSKPDYALLVKQLGTTGLEAQELAGHRLVHIKTRGEYDKSLTGKQTEFYWYHHTELGSSYIARHVYQNIRQQHATSLLTLLNVYPRPASLGTIFGQFFEQEAMKILSCGGIFYLPFVGCRMMVKVKCVI